MSQPAKKHVVVTGATSLVGDYLLPRLLNRGLSVTAISRQPRPATADSRVQWLQADITKDALVSRMPKASLLLHLAPLSLLPNFIQQAAELGVHRLIAFGTTSCFTKANSADPAERALVERFLAAEKEVEASCQLHDIHWTLFRPTLIYSPGRDKNLSLLAGFIRRYRFFPLLGKGKGKRQPVHAADLAEACLSALESAATYNRSYNLSGGETLSYRAMVERIFRGSGLRPRFLPIPERLFCAGVRVVKVIPRYRALKPTMVMRMQQDLCFAHDDASEDFGFSPRRFEFRI